VIDSTPFYGSDAELTGVYQGAAVAFVCAAMGRDVPVSYTGKLDENDRLETLWFVVDGDAARWTSMTTNHDTFSRAA
jgi:hypothetical protein